MPRQNLTDPPRRHRPAIVVSIELEEEPVVMLRADTFEDERRLASWLEQAEIQVRIARVLLDAFEGLEEVA